MRRVPDAAGRRRILLGTAGLAVLGRTATAGASERRIGLLSVGTDPRNPVAWTPFLDAMHELGYVEGRTLSVARGFGSGDFSRLDGMMVRLLQSRPEVIVTSGTRETKAAIRAAPDVPVVMTAVADPVGDGIVPSLARPGGRVTGITFTVPGLGQKYVELLRAAAPGAGRFTVIANPPNPIPVIRGELERAAQAVGVQLAIEPAGDLAALRRAVESAPGAGAGGFIFPLDGMTFFHRAELARLVSRSRLPAIYAAREHVEAGGLMSYGPSYPVVRRRAAAFVDRILRGARPGDLPVEQPTQFELVVNGEAARIIGLAIPREILVRADEVIR